MKQIAISVFLAVLGSFLIQPLSNRFWRTSFNPKVVAGPYIWNLGIPKDGGIAFNVIFWLTFANEGDTPGTIQNLKLRICLPKGDWVVHPRFVVDGKRYYEMFAKQQYDASMWGEPYTPIYLPGKFQTTRSILFVPSIDFDWSLSFIEPGEYRATLSAQSLDSELVDVWMGSFAVSAEELKAMREKRQQIRRVVISEKPKSISCPREENVPKGKPEKEGSTKTQK